MPEGQVAGQTEQDVEADGEDPVNCELLQKIGITCAEGFEDDRAARTAAAKPTSKIMLLVELDLVTDMAQVSITPLRPIRPRGRTSRMITAMR